MRIKDKKNVYEYYVAGGYTPAIKRIALKALNDIEVLEQKILDMRAFREYKIESLKAINKRLRQENAELRKNLYIQTCQVEKRVKTQKYFDDASKAIGL